MDILVCVKRVPMVGGRVVVTADGQDVDTRMSGFTVSPHEECAVEEAVQITERDGGTVTVLTLGPPEAADQLRDMLSLGAHRGVLLETDGREWGPVATAAAIAGAVGELGASTFPLIFFGNEAADTGGYQVGIRVAHALGRPCVSGIKRLEVAGGSLRAGREYRGAQEVFDVALPAVVTVKEGINLPQIPVAAWSATRQAGADHGTAATVAGRRAAEGRVAGAGKLGAAREVLGHGAAAVPALMGVLGDLGLLPSAARSGAGARRRRGAQ